MNLNEDIEYVCPKGCGTFVYDVVPWNCGKCGTLMIEQRPEALSNQPDNGSPASDDANKGEPNAK